MAWGALAIACVGSRLATTVTYIEDPDSLRFALSVANEYDIAALQPHFPGYPVFWAAVELFYLPTGSFSAGFSLVGGLAMAGIIWAMLRFREVDLWSVEGTAIAATAFFCPLLWIMANRYMPDLLGTAGALAALTLLVRALRTEDAPLNERAALLGIVLTGLLAGLRLSYLPLVLVPAVWVLACSQRPGRLFAAGTASVAVWLVPMLLDTGFWTLIDVAWGQTTGHFTEFGGTVQTESDLSRRFAGFVQGLWADGLGAWWTGRHPLTILVGLGAGTLSVAGGWRLWRRGTLWRRTTWILGTCALLYALWIFFFQNVVHKSRHVLPLVPLLLLVIAEGGATVWHRGARWGRGALLGVSLAYAAVTLVLVAQHMEPTAIAQAKSYIQMQTQKHSVVRVASVPLVNNYLRAQEVEAQYLSIEDSSDVNRLRQATTGRTLVVGTYASLLNRPPDRTHRFYHNPHVNRMWSEVTVYVYRADRGEK